MIIDSHAHYNNNAYKKPFRYLTRNEDEYALAEGDREQLFQELLDSNIPYSIEPGVSLQSCEEVLQLCAEYPDRIFPAMGIHPTRSIYEKWADRKKLDAFAKTPEVIAIGECGLDYHYKREEQHRLRRIRLKVPNTSKLLAIWMFVRGSLPPSLRSSRPEKTTRIRFRQSSQRLPDTSKPVPTKRLVPKAT